MKKKVLEKLINKFLSGTITEDERRNLENWYSSFENDKGFTDRLSDADKDELENSLLQKINKKIGAIEEAKTKEEKILVPVIPSYSIDKKTDRFSVRYKIAASFIAVVLLATLAYQRAKENTVTHTTAYGQMLHVTLPDSSVVVLNGNSKLTYKDQWHQREVSLEGEAFFSVKHTENDQKFIVHTSDVFNVEVLGTKFNVSKRKSGTRVVLNSGKIRLNFNEPEGSEQLLMKPGELIEFQNGVADYILKEVNAEVYSSWKENKLTLNRTKLSEILIMLHENYGLTATHVDKELLDQTVTGSMPVENLDMLLENISITYGINISKSQNSIEIRKAHNK